LSRRKQAARVERRREHVEVNLLAEHEERGGHVKARRGCSVPFLGGVLLVSMVAVLHTVIT
jgi:hypothetical protein